VAKKFLKHLSIGIVTLGTTRVLIYTPLFNTQTISQVRDDILIYPATEDSPYRGWGVDVGLHFAELLTDRLVRYLIGRNNLVQSLVSTAVLYPLKTARVKIAIQDEGIKGFPRSALDPQINLVGGLPLALVHTALTIGLSDYALLPHVTTYLRQSAVVQDDRALSVTAETGSLLIAKLVLLPVEIYYKRQAANVRPPISLVKTWARSAVWTVMEVSLGLAEYWIYRTLNRNVLPDL
jgi:hypothetical protein